MDPIGVLCIILFCFIACLQDHCFGLECKFGQAIAMTGHSPFENFTTKQCTLEKQYCGAINCTVDDHPAYAFTNWDCYYDDDSSYHAENVKQKLSRQFKNVKCNFEFGRMNEDMGNDRPAVALPTRVFTAPTTEPPPIETSPTSSAEPSPTPSTALPSAANLKCLRGVYNHKGYGELANGECDDKEEQFCYIANCKAGEESYMAWGCAESNACAAIEQKSSMYTDKQFTCQCEFGGPGIDLSNQNLTVPLWKPPLSIMLNLFDIGSSSASLTLSSIGLTVGTMHFCVPAAMIDLPLQRNE